jgi:hypothetical protein
MQHGKHQTNRVLPHALPFSKELPGVAVPYPAQSSSATPNASWAAEKSR